MFRRRLFGIFFMLLGLCPGFSGAVDVKGLDEAEIAVASQEPDERQTALRSALAEVLVKVTGDRGVPAMSQAAAIMEKPERFVQQFEYRVAVNTASDVKQQLLWVRFYGRALTEAVAQAGLPVWGRSRPAVLVWMAVEDGEGRHLVGGEGKPELQAWMQLRARQRGLPLLFPLADIQDQSSLDFADVWGNFRDPVMKASLRYRPDAVVAARLYFDGAGNKWHGRWTLYQGDEAVDWEFSALTLPEVVQGGADSVADILAKRFARTFNPNAAAQLRVSVSDVDTLEAYVRVMRYLESLDPVTDVQVERIEPAQVTFRLAVRGSAEDVNRAVSLGETLLPLSPSGADTGQTDLSFQLQP